MIAALAPEGPAGSVRPAGGVPEGVILRLQSLRFVAAALVLVGHTLMEMVQHNLDEGALAAAQGVPWGIGVDIFFVISGFIITTASIQRPSTPGAVGDFLLHRIVRVWPTYAFFTALMVAATLAVPSFLKHARLDPQHIVASLTFVPWPRPDDGRYYPLLGQGWTLNYEMFFYVSFAVVLFLPARFRVLALWVGGMALIAAGQLFALPQPLAFYAHPVIAEFLFGVALSVGYRRLPGSPMLGLGLITAAIVFLSLVPVDTEVPSRALFAGIPAAAIVAGVLLLGQRGERVLGGRLPVLLGNASYALYLSHTFVVNAVLWVMMRIFHPVPPMLFLAVAFVGASVVSIVAYRLVEQPALRLLKPRVRALRWRTD
ncbi:acyltransferase [Sphingomonas sp.]|uniref:acyltransferase family protein n=1 Tax=Sphingomonas sp. TaxID=28214 RepID=UPI0025EB4D42|nr:acyltransferase [Sphingomonas sp.]